MQLYNRVIQVFIANNYLKNFTENLRVSFDITKDNNSIANKATISIFNMSPNNRNQILELDDYIVVKAGYAEQDGPKLIFAGNILRVNHQYNLPDVVTKIEAGDGITALRESRASMSFEANTPGQTVLDDVANRFGLDVQEIPSVSGEYLQGFSHTGSVKSAMDKIASRFKLDWSIQNGKLQVIEKKKASRGPEIRITPLDGQLEKVERLGDIRQFLVKNVAQEKPGYRVKTLLNPDITPGGVVTLHQAQFPGKFKVQRVQHIGDNFEGEFISVCEIKELKA